MKTQNKENLQCPQVKELTVVKALELPFSTTSIKNLGWTDDETTAWKLQNASPPWGRMSEDDRSKALKALLLQITVTTGWGIPGEKELRHILYDQFNKKLTEDYASLNFQEIEYAFRSIGPSVEDWGKSINLNLVDKVLIPYIHKRAAVREMESRASKQAPLKAVEDFSWGENCELNYQKYLSGRLNISLLPWQCYEEFVKADLMAEDAFEDFIKRASVKLLAEEKTNKQTAIMAGRKLLAEEISKTIEQISATSEISPRVIEYAKRLAVIKLYSHAKALGREHLFFKE